MVSQLTEKILVASMIFAVLLLVFTPNHVANYKNPLFLAEQADVKQIDENVLPVLSEELVKKDVTETSNGLALVTVANGAGTFAEIRDFLIVPEGSVVFDRNKTSYYTLSEELDVYFSGGGTKEMKIYTSSIRVPTYIKSNSDINWNYDYGRNAVVIKSVTPMKWIVMSFSGFVPDGVVFIEDTKKIEYYTNRIQKLSGRIMEFSGEKSRLETEVNVTSENLEHQHLTLDEFIEDAKAKGNETAELNKTISNYKLGMNAKVIIDPAFATMAAVIVIILVAMLLDMVVIRGAKNGRK